MPPRLVCHFFWKRGRRRVLVCFFFFFFSPLPGVVCFILLAICIVTESNYGQCTPHTPPPSLHAYSHSHISPNCHAAFTLQTNLFFSCSAWNAIVKCGSSADVKAVVNVPCPSCLEKTRLSLRQRPLCVCVVGAATRVRPCLH